MVDSLKIGRVCFEDDEFILDSMGGPSVPRNRSNTAYADHPSIIYSLKHRLLVFLFDHAQYLVKSGENKKALLEFYRLFDYFVNLRMWKMQIIDKDHLLIKVR